ncbi:MAG: hypothetical protein AMXMBFR58_15390 [Phycisphaerae bacterium]
MGRGDGSSAARDLALSAGAEGRAVRILVRRVGGSPVELRRFDWLLRRGAGLNPQALFSASAEAAVGFKGRR